jgi:hypothetical protein
VPLPPVAVTGANAATVSLTTIVLVAMANVVTIGATISGFIFIVNDLLLVCNTASVTVTV